MPVDDIAPGNVIGAPERIQDLVTRHHLTSMSCQEIQQALLQPCQVKLHSPGSYLALHDVDLDLAELQDRIDRERLTVAATGDHQDPGKQLLGRKGDRHDVVDPLLERGKLRSEVAAPRQSERRDASSDVSIGML